MIHGEEETAGRDGLGGLIKRLADDGRALVRQEVELAKIEVRSSVTAVARGSVFVAAGALFLVLGLLVLLVFALLGLGRLLDGQYWLSSLIIGGILSLGGVVLLLMGRKAAARDALRPDRAIAEAKETKEWARSEMSELKSDLSRKKI